MLQDKKMMARVFDNSFVWSIFRYRSLTFLYSSSQFGLWFSSQGGTHKVNMCKAHMVQSKLVTVYMYVHVCPTPTLS